MDDCVFCKIIKGEIPSDKKFEDNNFLVFADIHPSAPIHFLIVPKKHLTDLAEADEALWNGVRKVALELQQKLNLKGFRLATNVGDTAAIKHLHVHFLGGIKKDRSV